MDLSLSDFKLVLPFYGGYAFDCAHELMMSAMAGNNPYENSFEFNGYSFRDFNRSDIVCKFRVKLKPNHITVKIEHMEKVKIDPVPIGLKMEGFDTMYTVNK